MSNETRMRSAKAEAIAEASEPFTPLAIFGALQEGARSIRRHYAALNALTGGWPSELKHAETLESMAAVFADAHRTACRPAPTEASNR